MTRWLGVSLAVLLAGCAANNGVQKGAVLDAAIVNLIPPESVALVGVNITQTLKTPLYQKLGAERKLPEELDEIARRIGVDVKRDLRELYVASHAKQNLVIARVQLSDQAAVERELEAKGAKRLALGNRTAFTSDGHAVVFLDSNLAVAGSIEAVRAAVEGSKGDDSHRRAILARLAALPRSSHAWAVSVGGFPPMPVPERGNLANLNRVFASLEGASLSLDLSEGVALAASGDCADEKSAKKLHDTLRGLIGFGRLSTPADRPEMLKLFDGINVAINGNAVNVNAKAPLDIVESLLQPRL